MAELCLGTVQFGMKYGIHNQNGQPSEEECFEMLDLAYESGIRKFDTAFAYGTAEDVLGKFIEKRKLSGKLDVISKLKPNILDGNEQDVVKLVTEEAKQSIERLKVDKLDGYLLHTPAYIYNTQILEGLKECKKRGLVTNIGISIYEIEDGVAAVNTGIIDYIQLPYSILDQRGMKEKFLSYAKENNVTIFARSGFLQGLIMMEEETIPEYLNSSKTYLKKFDDILKKYNVEKVNGLIHFVLDNEYVDYFVFGVDTKQQLLEDLECAVKKTVPKEFIEETREAFQNIEKSIIFPSLWAKR
ncbi:aldo/keto reductase [Anaeromicropila populeti]|uniref:Predicted oxidoreductase n=1 Tax=Anaeromicropila populeti TaxID=37658 RepID=A0A1I6HW45_9FIRM|nr:aldo/keto reductase [Anaeromicropila populeti]SFR58649.1 Predicted oxidoreductase [Anaeromicropila populeti]